MKIMLIQDSPYITTLTGASKADKFLVERLAEKKNICRVVSPLDALISFGDKRISDFIKKFLNYRGRIAFSSSGLDIYFFEGGIEVHYVINTLQLSAALRQQIEQFKPDCILLSSYNPGQPLLEPTLNAAESLAVFILAHATFLLPFGTASFLVNPKHTKLFKQASLIITVSNYMKNYIKQWSGLDSVVMPFPVYDSEPFPYFGNFDEGFVTFVNPCSFKGISIFLGLAIEFTNTQFAVVPGWGTTKKDLKDLRLLPNVKILRWFQDINKLLSQTRILLVPSLCHEAFGIIVVEAMLRGIPVLASNAGGLPEAKLGVDYILPVVPIENYEEPLNGNIRLVPVIAHQDISPWIRTLKKLLSEREHYYQLSKASRKAALSYVSKIQVEHFENIFQSFC